MDTKNQAQKISAFILAATGVIMFSAKAIFVKQAYVYEINTVSLLLIRMGIALPIYITIALFVSFRKNQEKLQWKDVFSILALGCMGYYLASFFDFHGLQFITASLERLILFIYPTLVLLISSLVLKKKIYQNQKIAIVITYVGVLIAFYRYNSSADNNGNLILGAGLIFASALSYAIFLVGSGNLIPRLGSVRYTSYAMIVSCLAVLLHFSLGSQVNIFSYPSEVYKIGMEMALISTVIPSFMLGEAIKQIGASNVAIVGSIGPVSTIVMATIFLNERIGVFQILGTLVVIFGVLLITLSKRNVANT